jgi:hypothetical protein
MKAVEIDGYARLYDGDGMKPMNEFGRKFNIYSLVAGGCPCRKLKLEHIDGLARPRSATNARALCGTHHAGCGLLPPFIEHGRCRAQCLFIPLQLILQRFLDN